MEMQLVPITTTGNTSTMVTARDVLVYETYSNVDLQQLVAKRDVALRDKDVEVRELFPDTTSTTILL